MGRNFYYAARAAGRMAVRERNRMIQAQQRENIRIEKTNYLDSRILETQKMDSDIKRRIDDFNDFCTNLLNKLVLLKFEDLKKSYLYTDFKFRTAPIYIDNSCKIVVTKIS